MGGGRIVPRSLKTTGNKNCFQPKPKKVFLSKSFFPKFDPLTVIGTALCIALEPKCQNLFCLV